MADSEGRKYNVAILVSVEGNPDIIASAKSNSMTRRELEECAKDLVQIIFNTSGLDTMDLSAPLDPKYVTPVIEKRNEVFQLAMAAFG